MDVSILCCSNGHPALGGGARGTARSTAEDNHGSVTMPMYEYECAACGQVTESLRPMAKADGPLACEHCGHEQTHRVHSVFAAQSDSAAGAGDAAAPPCGMCGDPRGSCQMG